MDFETIELNGFCDIRIYVSVVETFVNSCIEIADPGIIFNGLVMYCDRTCILGLLLFILSRYMKIFPFFRIGNFFNDTE